jgi:hypothetical protein
MKNRFKNYLMLAALLINISLNAEPIKTKTTAKSANNIIIRGNKAAAAKRFGVVLGGMVVSTIAEFVLCALNEGKNKQNKGRKDLIEALIVTAFPATLAGIIAHKISINKKLTPKAHYGSIAAAAVVGATTSPAVTKSLLGKDKVAILTLGISFIALPGTAAYLYSDGLNKSKVSNRLAEAATLIAESDKSTDSTQLNYLHDLMAALKTRNQAYPFNEAQKKSFNESRIAYATLLQSLGTKNG